MSNENFQKPITEPRSAPCGQHPKTSQQEPPTPVSLLLDIKNTLSIHTRTLNTIQSILEECQENESGMETEDEEEEDEE